MNDSMGVTGRSWRAYRVWRPAARIAAAFIAAAVLVLAAACGSSPSSSGSASSPTSSGSANSSGGASTSGASGNSTLLAFSQCMRAHNVPNFPDPQATGDAKFPSAQQLHVSGSTYQTAETACQSLLPAGTDDQFPAGEVQELLIGMRAFSQCMRSHGVQNWPDPSVNSQGQPYFELSAHGFTRAEAHSSQIQNLEGECQHLLPSALGGTPIS
jgi:hypothetical protein